jgi:hypothetical protein
VIARNRGSGRARAVVVVDHDVPDARQTVNPIEGSIALAAQSAAGTRTNVVSEARKAAEPQLWPPSWT